MFIKKFDVVWVVIVRIKQFLCWVSGMSICFDDNVVVIINVEGNFWGIRVFGFVVWELWDKNFIKIVFLVLEVFQMIKIKLVFYWVKMYVKKGDIIQVIFGKDKGKVGEVLCIIFSYSQVVVKGVNICIKYVKFCQEGEFG